MNPWANPPATTVIDSKAPTSLAFTRGDMSERRVVVVME
jgi:hypothetical protein